MFRKLVIASAAFALTASLAGAQDSQEVQKMKAEFQTPPSSAMPRVWWHWMDGDITKDGIRKDLEWMHRVGVAGFHQFDAGFGVIPTLVDKPLVYMSDEWKDAFQYAVSVADELDMEMGIASSPGWSSTGGPWVGSKDGMKKLTWRQVDVEGGKSLRLSLPQPFATVGNFQDFISINEYGQGAYPADPYYQDIAVIAVKIQDEDIVPEKLGAKVTSSGGDFTLAQLTNGVLSDGVELSADSQGKWILYTLSKARTVKSVTLCGPSAREKWSNTPYTYPTVLESSKDGVTFTEVMKIPAPTAPSVQQTVVIPATNAKYFRLRAADSKAPLSVSEFVLHTTERVNHFEEKAAFSAAFDIADYPSTGSGKFPQLNDIVDLTNRMDQDGNITWNAPKGDWRIYRFGYSLTGTFNSPATPQSTGLEVDKLDKKAYANYFEQYLDSYKEASANQLGKKGFKYLMVDSYEAGFQNWTPAMADEFRKRRGYNMLYWLPVLAGEIVVSPEESDRFLFDFRKTIGELYAENYDQINGIIADYGMEGRYTESHENGRVYVVDGMDVKRNATVPMAAAWYPEDGNPFSNANSIADIRESASVAHIYGQNIVAGESFTTNGMNGGAYTFTPAKLKPVADAMMAAGLNMFFIHESPHQPVEDKKPGTGLFYFGQWFSRHETWAEQAGLWLSYLGRSSYLLQQGRSVSDVLVYYGEDTNVTAQFGTEQFDLASGYNYDFISPSALIGEISVRNGKLVTDSGQKYEVLYINDNVKYMSIEVLLKIKELAADGAFICGAKPQYLASKDGSEQEFNELVSEIWGGKYKTVTAGKKLIAVLKDNNIKRDVTLPSSDDMYFVHRQTEDTDIYWISKPSERSISTSIGFRVTGKVPHIWDPVTGEIRRVSFQVQNDVTFVTLPLGPVEALFIVFTDGEQRSLTLPKTKETDLLTVGGTWTIAFQQGRGAPESTTVESLKSLSEFYDAGIRYFSGEAVYTNTFTCDNASGRVVLDLGDVRDIAQVKINGLEAGSLWKAPYRLDVTDLLKSGENSIEVKVVNTWANRIIGDQQPDADTKYTQTPFQFYNKDSELIPSGLIGPVRLVSVE